MIIKKNQLEKIVGKDNVFNEEDVLQSYSFDESLGVHIKASFVVKPKSATEVQKIVLWANDTKTPLVPVSSGPPHFHGASVPSTSEAAIIDLTRMNKILQIDKRNRIAIIEPGLTYTQLQPQLARNGLRISTPLAPKPNKSVLASLLEREPSLIPRYQWAPLDPLRCIEIVWGDGMKLKTGDAGTMDSIEEANANKLSPLSPMGPGQTDFIQIVSGSQGCMGIVTWASIKCEILPTIHKLFCFPSNSLQDLINFIYKILRFRVGDEILMLNNSNLASIMGENIDHINELKTVFHRWFALVGIAGRNILPQERVKYQESSILSFANEYNLNPVREIGGIKDLRVMDGLLAPSKEPYWKMRYKGSWRDIIFLTTLDKTVEFEKIISLLADKFEYPISDISFYVQPMRQGAYCHCEFGIPYDPKNTNEKYRIRDFFAKASEEVFKKGAYFSRPYGIWANMAYNRDAQSTILLKMIKNIFDPNHIMNPGKLCF